MSKNFKSEYAQKLRDPRWQKKRLEVLERDRFKCKCCGNTKDELQVHHLDYGSGEPWDVPLDCLETLCIECHKRREVLQRVIVSQIKRMQTVDFLVHGSPLICAAVNLSSSPSCKMRVKDMVNTLSSHLDLFWDDKDEEVKP